MNGGKEAEGGRRRQNEGGEEEEWMLHQRGGRLFPGDWNHWCDLEIKSSEHGVGLREGEGGTREKDERREGEKEGGEEDWRIGIIGAILK
jgi:hypothetical protein